MKPESWKTLPYSLLNTILWDIDSLDFCSYESSMAECIDEIENGHISSTNERIINAYWKALSNESFELYVRDQLESVQCQAAALEELLNNP